jgi:hypothetical protein
VSRSSRSSDPGDLIASGRYVQAGRIHESRHQIEEAIGAYVEGGAWQEAARLLSFQGKFRDAGMTLLRSLPDRPTPVIRISPEVRRDAMNAALCFARGGARREAVGLLINLGEHQRAAGLLSMAGLREDAVRVMRGEHIEGSPWPPGILFNPASDTPDDESGPQWAGRAASQSGSGPGAASAPWEQATEELAPPQRTTGEVARPVGGGSGEFSRPAPPPPPPGARPRVQPKSEPYLSDSLEFRPMGLDEVPRTSPPRRSTSSPGERPSQSRTPPPPSRTPRFSSPTPNPLSATPSTMGGSTGRSGASVPGVRAPGRLRRGTPGSLVQQELASYLATSPSDRSYPIAVNRVIELVWNAELLAARVSRFLDDFLGRAGEAALPDTAWSTLYALGRLFEFHDRIDGAKQAYRTLLRDAPRFADVRLRLDNIEKGLAEAEGGKWLPVHLLIDGVHRFSPLPDFEDMPTLGESPAGSVGVPPSGNLDRDAPPPPRPTSPGRQPTAEETLDFEDYRTASGRVSAHASDTVDVDPRDSGRHRRQQSATASYAGTSGPNAEMREDGSIVGGTVIANRYQIEGLIGSGGMAHVYRATDLELEEVVAIKVFQQVVQNRAGLDRFRREMKLSRKLVHPNIVRIYEFGTWRGARFITMELLDGDDLDQHLKKAGGPLGTSEALRLMIQACDGLGAAHEAGVIHRDVKPQNLFVIENGTRLKVMDFGIAKVNNSAASISVTGVRVGTPRYMSPEQIQGDAKVTPASDLYALGGVMYELFTGTPVFQEEDLVPLLLSHMTEEPEPPRQRHASVPVGVEEIILRLLSKTPEERYPNCVDLKKALLKAFVASQRG